MRYNKESSKETVKKDGRRLLKGGPRDMQRRAVNLDYDSDVELINKLNDEIKKLRSELSNHPIVDTYTAEQLDNEVSKAVESAVNEMTASFKVQLKAKDGIIKDMNSRIEDITDNFNKKIKSLEEIISVKSLIIDDLKNSRSHHRDDDNEAKTVGERPVMEDVFVDPLDSGSGKHLKSFISIESLSVGGKEETENKINKLKKILGNKLKET
jgi:cell fate (sporulation/competence/biofilm development) regulator YmcA (YheA/YmcA/DUF963 family)